MDIIIKPLTPNLAEDYARFFDETPHDDKTNKNELPFYCVTWRSDESYSSDNRHWFATREERRERAINYVNTGNLQGYLAYYKNKIVGWCNATADCQGGVNYLRKFWPIEEYRSDIKVKSVFCFVIAPEMQRTGIATKLLERVCQDSAADGFDFVEAYVYKNFSDVAHDFRGPLAMYEKCGFVKCAEQDGKVVVRKPLKLMRLFHVSEDPDVKIFHPRLPRRAELDPNVGLVWSLIEPSLPNWLFPRECPRVGYRICENTTSEDKSKFFTSSASHVVAIEHGWHERQLNATLHVYEFEPTNFYYDEAAGFYVSQQSETPINMVTYTNLYSELFKIKVEVRLIENLWPLRDAVFASSMKLWSFCKMANAKPREQNDMSEGSV